MADHIPSRCRKFLHTPKTATMAVKRYAAGDPSRSSCCVVYRANRREKLFISPALSVIALAVALDFLGETDLEWTGWPAKDRSRRHLKGLRSRWCFCRSGHEMLGGRLFCLAERAERSMAKNLHVRVSFSVGFQGKDLEYRTFCLSALGSLASAPQRHLPEAPSPQSERPGEPSAL